MCYNIDIGEIMIIDLLCSDYKAAADNRRMVRLKQNIEWWIWMEGKVKSWPKNKLLPGEFLGRLPTIGKHESRELYGFHEVNE